MDSKYRDSIIHVFETRQAYLAQRGQSALCGLTFLRYFDSDERSYENDKRHFGDYL
jgi:hypothetical protein